VQLVNRMAAKTSVFYLTERLELDTSGAIVTDTIDLGAYCDVADRQGVLVHDVDFVFQGVNSAGVIQPLDQTFSSNGTMFVQVTDLNRASLVYADDRALVASGQLLLDQANNVVSSDADLYPDNFGPTSAQGGRIVINDQMYFVGALNGTLGANEAVQVTARIKCSIISLSQKDFMAIALQSQAADN
jgi:hypothetical protein